MRRDEERFVAPVLHKQDEGLRVLFRTEADGSQGISHDAPVLRGTMHGEVELSDPANLIVDALETHSPNQRPAPRAESQQHNPGEENG
ncbi:MAG: hypothetical protein AMXMBFR82_45200 [Candidatus Hydrogenedentota bacterium]